MQSANKIWPVYVIFQKKNFYQKILLKLLPENQLQTLLCLQRIKRNLYWKVKFLKCPAFIRYVIAKISRFAKSTCTHPQSPFYRGFSENQKGHGSSFQATFFIRFFDINFSF